MVNVRRTIRRQIDIKMQVEFTEEITVTGYASINIDDITAALLEAIADVELSADSAEDKTQAHLIKRFVTDCFQMLGAVTPEMQEKVLAEHRQIISDALRKIADSWCDDHRRKTINET